MRPHPGVMKTEGIAARKQYAQAHLKKNKSANNRTNGSYSSRILSTGM
jgi:hypothetical protein